MHMDRIRDISEEEITCQPKKIGVRLLLRQETTNTDQRGTKNV